MGPCLFVGADLGEVAPENTNRNPAPGFGHPGVPAIGSTGLVCLSFPGAHPLNHLFFRLNPTPSR